MSSLQVKTPPHQWNLDWYRVQYRLASTLANDACVKKTSFVAASEEIESLLRACWRVLDPLPWKRLRKRNRETIRFVDKTVVPAALDLKALIDLGLNGFDPGEDQRWGLRSVRRRIRARKPVTPLTIVEAIIASKKKRGPSLCFDLACFFHLSGDDSRAMAFVKEGFAAVPTEELKRYQERVAADPMLQTIPGIVALTGKVQDEKPSRKRWCRLLGKRSKPKQKGRPWA